MQELLQKNLRHRNTFGCIKGSRAGTLRQKEAGFYGKGHIPAAPKPQYAPYPRRIQPHGGPGLAPKPAAARCGVGVSVGGGICLLGEWLRKAFLAAGHTLGDAAALTSITLIGLSALCTALGWYQKLAAKAGAGTLVPITGFANAVVSQAIEFKVEGLVTGVGAKMFVIAGPVIVYGTMASWAWGLLYAALRAWG